MSKVSVSIQPLEEGVVLPSYATPEAAGADISAHVPEGSLVIEPFGRIAVPTGFAMALPYGYEAQIRPRSGLAKKMGITVINSPGTIDSDYRGEVKILLVNMSNKPVELRHGERIAQMVIAPVVHASFEETKTLTATERGAGGFGSTGT